MSLGLTTIILFAVFIALLFFFVFMILSTVFSAIALFS